MRKLAVALAAGTVALVTIQAGAQTPSPVPSLQSPRYYLGLGANFADHEYKLPGAINVEGDDYEASYKVFGGAELDPLWGAEIGYTDFSDSDFNYLQGAVPGRGKTKGYGVYIAGRGRWPIHPQADVYGKLGVAFSHRRVESDIPLAVRRNNDDTGVYAAVGLQWNIDPQWALVGEYERYGRSKKIGSKADVWTIGARYNF